MSTQPPQSEEESTIHAMNIHGAFFERWCQAVVGRTEWAVKYANYPVEFHGVESALDVRADRFFDHHLVSLLIECKKNNPDFVDWIFFAKRQTFTGTPLLINQLRTYLLKVGEAQWSVDTLIGGMPWNSPIADEARETRGKYAAYKGQDKTKTSNAAITEAARQVAVAVQAITREDQRHGSVIGSMSPPPQPNYRLNHLVPVIVTTAKLYVCEFDPENVDSRTGEIPSDKVNLKQVPHLRFEYPMPRSLQGTPEDLARDLVDGLLERFQRLQILVINSEGFEAFLGDFALDPANPMFR